MSQLFFLNINKYLIKKMEINADDQSKNEWRKQRDENWSKRRRKIFEERIFKKRLAPAYKVEQKAIQAPVHEESEAKNEEVMKDDLAKHKHKKKRSKKKCWWCRSPYHFKKQCPKIRCYHCKRLGYMVANCWRKKVDYIFQRMKEDLQRKAETREERKNLQKSKERNRILEINIIKKRAQYFEGFLKRTERRGDVYWAKWKEIELGEYNGPKLLSSAIDKIRSGEYNLKYVNILTEKAAPYQNFALNPGLSNWCHCGRIDLEKKDFIAHVKELHKGII